MDTWLLLREVELNGERNRLLNVIKARGMAHSNQVRELLLTGDGIELVDVYLGPGGALTGAARLAQEAEERDAAVARQEEIDQQRRELERRREALEARIRAQQLEFQAEEENLRRRLDQAQAREQRIVEDRLDMARLRKVNGEAPESRTGGQR
jgi:circadian clock protein KaiC